MRTIGRWLAWLLGPPLAMSLVIVADSPSVQEWWEFNGVGILLFHLLLMCGALIVLVAMIWDWFGE